jgi:spermidine synthase
MALYVLTLLTGSFLLFLMQPMVARMALPQLGGTPAVWNSAMVVFQGLLLAGYFYAHLLGWLRPRLQAVVHLAAFVLAAAWLPIGLATRTLPVDANPVLWVPVLFAGSIGPLFMVVAAQAPLMQRWYGLVAPQADPYKLYAASNLGSFGGLIAYPILLEPLLGVRAQSILWSGGFALLALLVATCAWRLPPHQLSVATATRAAPAVSRRLLWTALAAVPAGMILSTTTHLSTDIVAMPLLWVVPLGLYLLSFALAFSERGQIANWISRAYPFVLVFAAMTAFAAGIGSTVILATSTLVTLFATAVALHRRLYLLRPEAARLTGFYLTTALGGVIGGSFCALLAPALFDWGYEQPLLIAGAAFLMRPRPSAKLMRRLWLAVGQTRVAVAIGLAAVLVTTYASGLVVAPPVPFGRVAIAGTAVLAVASVGRPLLFGLTIAALLLTAGGSRDLRYSIQFGLHERSYFGIYTVTDRGATRELISGTTLHGVQRLTPGQETWPTSYYAPGSGVGEALSMAPVLYGSAARIGVVGLGTGTLACYARPGQEWRFYEIDPTVVRIATDPRRFTFLALCAPKARIVIGDARLMLARSPSSSHDLLAIDAFSSDAVPMHLLTVEALDVYGRALSARGLLLVHISNRYLDLEPIVAAAAAARGWHGLIDDYRPDAHSIANGAGRSMWIALSRSRDTVDRLIAASDEWRRLAPRSDIAAWTDDHASILPVLR